MFFTDNLVLIPPSVIANFSQIFLRFFFFSIVQRSSLRARKLNGASNCYSQRPPLVTPTADPQKGSFDPQLGNLLFFKAKRRVDDWFQLDVEGRTTPEGVVTHR